MYIKILKVIRHGIMLQAEKLRYFRFTTPTNNFFYIVSCERNAGEYALRCLESVWNQDYPKKLVAHHFIDDSSTDGTEKKISDWLKDHPGHCVKFEINARRKGGTANTLFGFRRAPSQSIVLELNGDDWLPDDQVFKFLNKVYNNDKVWMTYNTFKFADGKIFRSLKPYSRKTIKQNKYRDKIRWTSSHLHTFRKELFLNIDEERFIDPATGQYWGSADDQAIYLCMLELAGKHARHIYRITYVYNFHEMCEERIAKKEGLERVKRIRSQNKYAPLNSLSVS